MSATVSTAEAIAVAPRAAWEVIEDGTVWPVTVLSAYKNMFGYWRVQRQDGSVVSVYHVNLRAADNIDVRYTR